jgi:pyruvate,water dikinase
MRYSTPLEALRRGDESRFGGKSASLGELFAAGVPVPSGFALGTDALVDFVTSAGLQEAIDETLNRISADDLDSLGSAADAIAKAIRSAPLPDEIVNEVESHYERLRAHEPSAPVAVRSSAVGEDTQEATFAGQLETFLWVRGSGAICDAVRDCWVSLYSAPAISYRARHGDRVGRPEMGVAVQLMVDAALAGVMFTCNPVSGDRSMVAINASWGLGIAVVGGEVTPDELLVSKVTGEVVSEQIHDKDGVCRAVAASDRRPPS